MLDQSKTEDHFVSLLAEKELGVQEKGLGAFVARGFREEISEEDRILLAGKVAARRLAVKQYQTTMIIRQSEFVAHSLMKEILEAVDFPVPENELIEFFDDVSKGNQEKVSKKLAPALRNRKVVDTLLPFYHAYMDWAEKNGKPRREAQEIFLGMVSFAFIETKAISLAMDPREGGKASAAFRSMREKGVMGTLLKELEDANQSYEPQSLSTETIDHLSKIYNTREKEFHEIMVKYNETQGKAKNLIALYSGLSQCFEKDSYHRNHLLKIQETIDHAHDTLKKALARGDRISDDDIQNVNTLLDKQLENLNQEMDGLTPLQRAAQQGKGKLVNDLLKAGVDPTLTTKGYERSRKQIFKDLSRDPPLRNAAQIAEMNGDTQMAEIIQAQISRIEKERADLSRRERSKEESPTAHTMVAAARHAESFAAERKQDVSNMHSAPEGRDEEMINEWKRIIESEGKKNQAKIEATKKSIDSKKKLGVDTELLKQNMAFYLRVRYALTELSNFIPTAKSNQAISEKAKVVLKQVEDRLGPNHRLCQILTRMSKGERADDAPRSAPRMDG